MKFPRNVRILRSHFDMAPFVTVFFLLVIFVMLGAFIPTPGLPLQLQPPSADDLPGTGKLTVAVAVDYGGRFYFGNQIVTEAQLKTGLGNAVKNFRSPLTLVIHADRSVTYEQLLSLTLLARANGIDNAMLATLPRVTDTPATP